MHISLGDAPPYVSISLQSSTTDISRDTIRMPRSPIAVPRQSGKDGDQPDAKQATTERSSSSPMASYTTRVNPALSTALHDNEEDQPERTTTDDKYEL